MARASGEWHLPRSLSRFLKLHTSARKLKSVQIPRLRFGLVFAVDWDRAVD